MEQVHFLPCLMQFASPSTLVTQNLRNRPFQFVLEKIGAEPSQSIFVGDGGGDELRGAKDAGFGLVVFAK
jgi:hypothetical protein